MNGKHRLTVCLEGLYYLVVLAFIVGGAILREINLLYVLAGMLMGPLIYNWWAATSSLRRVVVHRKLPTGVCAGDLLVVDFEASADAHHACAAMIVRDRIQRLTGGGLRPIERAEVFFPLIEPGQTDTRDYRGRLAQRGRYQFGPFIASTRFPLGLVRYSVYVDDTETFIVCPRIGRLTPRWNQVRQAALLGSGGARSRQGLVEGDFYGLRDWRSGDSRRWIHWRTSARRGNLAVRQFEQPRSQDVVVLLESWQPETPTPQDLQNVETAISFAATITEEVCRRGNSRLGMGIAGKEITWKQAGGSRPFLQEVLEQLAVVEATSADRLAELLSRCLPEVARGAILVVVSTRPIDLHDTDRLATVWQSPSLRHLLRKAICIDASSNELAEFFSPV